MDFGINAKPGRSGHDLLPAAFSKKIRAEYCNAGETPADSQAAPSHSVQFQNGNDDNQQKWRLSSPPSSFFIRTSSLSLHLHWRRHRPDPPTQSVAHQEPHAVLARRQLDRILIVQSALAQLLQALRLEMRVH